MQNTQVYGELGRNKEAVASAERALSIIKVPFPSPSRLPEALVHPSPSLFAQAVGFCQPDASFAG